MSNEKSNAPVRPFQGPVARLVLIMFVMFGVFFLGHMVFMMNGEKVVAGRPVTEVQGLPVPKGARQIGALSPPSQGAQEVYRLAVPQTEAAARAFYQETMPKLGWEERKSHASSEESEPLLLSYFNKAGEACMISFSRTRRGETRVNVIYIPRPGPLAPEKRKMPSRNNSAPSTENWR